MTKPESKQFKKELVCVFYSHSSSKNPFRGHVSLNPAHQRQREARGSEFKYSQGKIIRPPQKTKQSNNNNKTIKERIISQES